MKLVLLRHGETNFNAQNRFQGQVDIPLNARGVRQVRTVARALNPDKWSVVYSSTLIRAVRTAHIISRELHIPHIQLDELCERDLGELDGLDKTEYKQLHPEEMKRLQTDYTYAPPRGETPCTALARFHRGLELIVDTGEVPTNKAVLVVAHGGMLNIFAQQFLGGELGRTDMVGNCRAISLNIKTGGHGVLMTDANHWDVDPQICESSWFDQEQLSEKIKLRTDEFIMKIECGSF